MKASLSIFMSMTLMVVLSLCLVLIEGARQNTIRLEAECVMDIGMNSVLAEYHREALEQYNLFFIDSSYGTDTPSFRRTEDHLRSYLEKNISGDVAPFQGIYMDLLGMSFPEVRVTGVSLPTDNGGYTFQKQAIRAMESDIGIGVIEEVQSWIHVVEQYSLLDNRTEEQIEELEKSFRELEEESWVTADVENPVAEITEARSKGLLSWVLRDGQGLSGAAVNPRQYISHRRKEQINQGNMDIRGELNFYDRLTFHEYLLRYSGNYTEPKENSQLVYQQEYLLFGDGTDADNLKKTAAAICGMREVANLVTLMNDEGKRAAVSAVSAVLAAALFVPEAQQLFEGIILIAWSCAESLRDTQRLLEGNRVALIKDSTDWRISLDSLFGGSHEEDDDGPLGLMYEDYLRIFLYFADIEDITYRFMDLMEMDIRRTPGNRAFRMDGCIDYLEAEVRVSSSYHYEYCLRHGKGY